MNEHRTIRLEYGDSWMDVDVPGDAVVVKAGETFEEPEPLPDPVAETRRVLREPVDGPPLRELAGEGSEVTIAFPDRVKGGTQETAHRKVAIPLILEELAAAGVRERDVTLVCAIGLHRKNHYQEIAGYLGEDLVRRFRGKRLVNHDAEDPEGIVDLGETEDGDVAEVNKAVAEADLSIMLGHAQGNPYGGYSGGYKMPCTGLTTWHSIRCHHTPDTMYRNDFVPASTKSHFRGQLQSIGHKIEEGMSQPFFAVDAVLNGRAQQTAVAAGPSSAVEQASWPAAAQRTDVSLEGEPADVLVLGMPRSFHYGPGMGSNPILMLQAIGSSIVRAGGALKPGAVVICASVCDGWFNDEWFPPYREIYEKFQRCAHVDEMQLYEDELSNRPDYIHKFRHAYGYHPYHGFSMLYMGGVALNFARAIYIAGAQEPGYARGIGCIPVRTFDEAVRQATRHVGENPKMLIVPEMSKPAVHPRVLGQEPARPAYA